jgi:hypothetical protein
MRNDECGMMNEWANEMTHARHSYRVQQSFDRYPERSEGSLRSRASA